MKRKQYYIPLESRHVVSMCHVLCLFVSVSVLVSFTHARAHTRIHALSLSLSVSLSLPPPPPPLSFSLSSARAERESACSRSYAFVCICVWYSYIYSASDIGDKILMTNSVLSFTPGTHANSFWREAIHLSWLFSAVPTARHVQASSFQQTPNVTCSWQQHHISSTKISSTKETAAFSAFYVTVLDGWCFQYCPYRGRSSSCKETQSASDFNIFWRYSFIAFRVNRLKWFVRRWSAFPSPQRRCQIKSGISGDGWHEHSDRLHKRRPAYNSWSLLPDAFRRDNKAFGIA